MRETEEFRKLFSTVDRLSEPDFKPKVSKPRGPSEMGDPRRAPTIIDLAARFHGLCHICGPKDKQTKPCPHGRRDRIGVGKG